MKPGKDTIDYDSLKKRGFLKAKQEGFFTLRTRMPSGNYGSVHIEKIADIAKRYGRGISHLTTRQGIEIPYIKYTDIAKVEQECRYAGILPGASGPRLRATTCCPGNNWCKRGLVDTFSLFKKLEEKSLECGLDLPHKFKIAISGCPNKCTRAEASEIGIHGMAHIEGSDSRIGYAIYLGGCGGRIPHIGYKLPKIYTEKEVLSIVLKVVKFYKERAKPRQRLSSLMEEMGREQFLKAADI